MVSSTSPTKASAIPASPASSRALALAARLGGQRPDGRAHEQDPAGGAFVCPVCKSRYGDPLYHGPAGHAPQQMCFDCWASEWGSMIQVLARGGNWRQIDSALFLLCQGFSYQEAANLAGICRKTLHNWIRQARQRPLMAPEWLISRAAARQRARL